MTERPGQRDRKGHRDWRTEKNIENRKMRAKKAKNKLMAKRYPDEAVRVRKG